MFAVMFPGRLRRVVTGAVGYCRWGYCESFRGHETLDGERFEWGPSWGWFLCIGACVGAFLSFLVSVRTAVQQQSFAVRRVVCAREWSVHPTERVAGCSLRWRRRCLRALGGS